MRSTLKLFALAALVLLVAIPAVYAQTPEASTLRLTEPLDVGGTVIQPGVYTIRVLPSFENRNKIQVTSPDLKTVYATALSVPHYVVPSEQQASTAFVFYPAGEDHPAALRTWYAAFPDASQGGHDIVYSKSRAEQLARISHSPVVAYQEQTADLNTAPLAVVTPSATVETYTPPATSVSTTETTTTTETVTTPTPAPMTSATPAPLVTEATPAPAPAPETPAPAVESSQTTMPHTASNTPLLALLGLGAIAGAIAIRFGRSI